MLDLKKSEDIFKVVTLNKNKMVQTKAGLQDTDGNDIDLSETVEELSEYVLDKMMEKTDNKVNNELFSILSQVLSQAAPHLLKSKTLAASILADEDLRYLLIYSNLLTAIFMKWMDKKNLQVSIEEEPISQEQIDQYMNYSKAAHVLQRLSALGYSIEDIVSIAVEKGMISKEELEAMGLGSYLENVSEPKEPESN